jgi:hypothetical protein
MNHSKLFVLAVLFVTATTAPALAQSSESHATGVNVTNAPGFSSSDANAVKTGYSDEVVLQAQQLATELKAAFQDYQAEQKQLSQGARRFARQAQTAPGPAQLKLNEVQAKVKQFLAQVKTTTP